MDYGLPYLYHPDEPGKIGIAQRILKTGDLDPHYYLKPPFYLYLNAAAYLPYVVVQMASGVPAQTTIQNLAPPERYAQGSGYTTQPLTVLIGRGVSVLFGSLCIILVYLLVSKVFSNRMSALVTALFVAVSPELAAHSRLITPDILVVFFCVLTVYFSINIYQRGRSRDYVLVGIAGALAASAKYEPAIVLVVPATAHVLANGFRGSLANKRIWISVLVAVVTFLMLNPPVVFNFNGFLNGITHETEHYSTGHFGMEGGSAAWYFGYFWWREGPMAVLGLIGMAVYGVKNPKMGSLLSIFPAVYFVFVSSFVVRNDRTAIPITPFLYIFAIQLLVVIWKSQPIAHLGIVWSRIAVLTATTAMLGFSALSVLQDIGDLLNVDARETSTFWIDHNIDPHAKIGVEGYAPFIENSFDRLVQVGAYARLIDHDLRWYQEEGFQFLVASRGAYGRYFRQPELYKFQIHTYRRLFAELQLVKEFDDTRQESWIFQKLRSFRERANSSQFWDGFMEVRIYRVPPAATQALGDGKPSQAIDYPEPSKCGSPRHLAIGRGDVLLLS